ncbi:hypothetical protein OZ411_13100 [Bradyrhizobium sp. Arg237L]|uniref:hypothetical protein n=1 Tax=Bradyrhizobium sp. Arg237L TaxID=3003352 RepID=UPI00249EE168|nr:hypothetical protein [Bradyrhizobium sp. Arg237L]MDI4233751.1 hypothetical protein [Bradyrhizobium sp. Arg237L]
MADRRSRYSPKIKHLLQHVCVLGGSFSNDLKSKIGRDTDHAANGRFSRKGGGKAALWAAFLKDTYGLEAHLMLWNILATH